MQTGFKGRVTCSLVCRACRFFPVILGRRFVGEKRYPKRRIATPTIRLPVAVDLGYIYRAASRDVIEGRPYNSRAP